MLYLMWCKQLEAKNTRKVSAGTTFKSFRGFGAIQLFLIWINKIMQQTTVLEYHFGILENRCWSNHDDFYWLKNTKPGMTHQMFPILPVTRLHPRRHFHNQTTMYCVCCQLKPPSVNIWNHKTHSGVRKPMTTLQRSHTAMIFKVRGLHSSCHKLPVLTWYGLRLLGSSSSVSLLACLLASSI